MKTGKLIFLIIFIILGIIVSISFARTMSGIIRAYMIEKQNASCDEFNQIFFKKGFWINPHEKYMKGSGLQKFFTYPICFKPSLRNDKVSSMSFDLEMSPIQGSFRIKNISDDYLVLLFGVSEKSSHGFRISAASFIQSGWIKLHNDTVRLIQPVDYTIESQKPQQVSVSITPNIVRVTIGKRAYDFPGNFSKGGVGFFLGTANIDIKNLEILYDEKSYKDLSPYDPTVPPVLLIIIFLIPIMNWLGYSYFMARYFKFDLFKFALSDFPVILLFLFFGVNPHKTFFYAIPLVLVLLFCARSMIFSKFLYHMREIRDMRKKGFAILAGITIAVFSGIYLLALSYADALQIGETYLEKKELSLPVFVILLLVSNYMFMYYDKFNQLIRLAAVSAAIVIFTAIPKYFNPNSYFATADKLFKPEAMYFHYNGMAKTKPMGNIIPGSRRIFFAGGSATFGFPLDIGGKAFPEQFEEILNKGGIKADVFNIGMLGHTASSLRYSIERNGLLDLYPMNMLVLYLGFNDASIYPKLYGFLDKTDWQSINYMNASGLPRRMFRMIQFSPPISYLLLLKSMVVTPAEYANGDGSKNRSAAAVNIPRVSVEEEIEHIKWFSSECRKRNIPLIIVPELYNRISSLSEALSQNPQQRAIVETARTLKIPVIDCYPEFDSKGNYYMYDLVHLNYNGNKKLAEILAVRLKPYLN